ncbi:arginine-hydroxylase NDUFAF5, mitochondrial [Chironomus tepperi]|uniref:arginine-hydroxylase NDUFAF5, mitochondrial n=1 Tax=Chironomus tepperi TaxID=113505 RepID=UPI00391FB35C
MILNRIRINCRSICTTAKKFRPIGNISQSSDVNIFDLFNTKRLQKERAAKRDDVEIYDYIKEEIGFRLSDRLFDIKKELKNGVDFGGGRGYLSKNILAETLQNLKIYDVSETMLNQAESTPGINIEKNVLKSEYLDLPENSQDVVISNLTFHWFNDLPGIFRSINYCLKPDGVFLASMFGGETLYELRSALHLAEQERRGGLSPHISPFAQIRDIGGLLNSSGFNMLTIDTDEMVVGYPSMFELLHDLKGMAENNAAFNRPLTLSRDVLLSSAAIYNEMYKKINPETKEEGVQATFQVIYFVGWKPHESQQKPAERGSASVSLKDLGTIMTEKNNKK